MQIHKGVQHTSVATFSYSTCYKLVHTGAKPHKFYQSDKTSSTASNLKSHMRTHDGDKPYQCSQCDRASLKTNNPKKHIHWCSSLSFFTYLILHSV